MPIPWYHIGMNYALLEQSNSTFFTVQKIAELLNISEASARVLASRYAAKNLLLSPKKNFYLLPERVKALSKEDTFYLSSLLQTPSYVSLQTALAYHEITTQMPRNFIEAVNPVRTCSYALADIDFAYTKIKKNLYFDFERKGHFFIASPEKALLDASYLEVLNRYSMDWSSLDFSKFDAKKIRKLAKKFPKKVQKFIDHLFEIYG